MRYVNGRAWEVGRNGLVTPAMPDGNNPFVPSPSSWVALPAGGTALGTIRLGGTSEGGNFHGASSSASSAWGQGPGAPGRRRPRRGGVRQQGQGPRVCHRQPQRGLGCSGFGRHD